MTDPLSLDQLAEQAALEIEALFDGRRVGRISRIIREALEAATQALREQLAQATVDNQRVMRALAEREQQLAQVTEARDEAESQLAVMAESYDEEEKLLWSLGHCAECHGTGIMQAVVGYSEYLGELCEPAECAACRGESLKGATAQRERFTAEMEQQVIAQRQELETLRAALARYASPEAYQEEGPDHQGFWIECDMGRTAREALDACTPTKSAPSDQPSATP